MFIEKINTNFSEKMKSVILTLVIAILICCNSSTVSAQTKYGNITGLHVSSTPYSVSISWENPNNKPVFISQIYNKYAKTIYMDFGSKKTIKTLVPNTEYTFYIFYGEGSTENYKHGKISTIKIKTQPLTAAVKKIASWEIGGDGSTYYNNMIGSPDVMASLYTDGWLRISGIGNTTLFKDNNMPPWCDKKHRSKIKYVTIEDTVQPTCMDYWFYKCNNLVASPSIASSVTSLTGTFWNCYSLKTTKIIPNDVEKVGHLFDSCYSLTNFPDIPSKVTSLSFTFSNCKSMRYAPEIPNGVEKMYYTFYGCTSLYYPPIIPDSMNLMNYTFCGCTKLVKAPDLPQNVNEIYGLFKDCSHLNGDFNIRANKLRGFNTCFQGTSTVKGVALKVNYSLENTDIVNAIIGTGGSDSNIIKGNLIE